MKKTLLLVIVFKLLILNAQGNYLEAINRLQKQQDSFEKFQKLGKIYDDTGFDSKAIQYYQKALELKPDIVTMNRLAKVYVRYGKPAAAIKVRLKINILDSTDYRNRYDLASLYAQSGRKDTAIVILQKLSEIDPYNPNYPYKIGLYSNNMNQKLDAFLEAYHRDPQHKKTLMMLVKNYKRIKFLDSADYYLQKGLQLYPNDTKFLRQKVIATYRKKQYQTMLKTLQKLDSLHYYDDLFVKKNTGLAYLMLRQYDTAEKYIREALKLDGRDAVLYYYLGKIYQATGQLIKARLYFLSAIGLKKPDIDKEYFELGMIAKARKQYRTAFKQFKKAYRNNHKNDDALLQMAILSEEVLKQLDKALQYYETYFSDFASKNKDKTAFVKSRIKALKQQLFLNKK